MEWKESKGHPSHLKITPNASETELQDLMFALLGFCLALVQSSIIYTFFSFGLGMGIFCHCILERYDMFSDFTRCHNQELILSSEEILKI